MKDATILQVHAPGTEVEFMDCERTGVVLAVTIREGGVASYEVAWWVDGLRHTAELAPHEICGAETRLRAVALVG